jgi:hypothetical protein
MMEGLDAKKACPSRVAKGTVRALASDLRRVVDGVAQTGPRVLQA